MRKPRLRDTDGTEFDPETGERVAGARRFVKTGPAADGAFCWAEVVSGRFPPYADIPDMKVTDFSVSYEEVPEGEPPIGRRTLVLAGYDEERDEWIDDPEPVSVNGGRMPKIISAGCSVDGRMVWETPPKIGAKS